MRYIAMGMMVWLAATAARSDTMVVWIGTTRPRGGESKGIYRAEFDSETGNLSKPQLAATVDSPGFVALHPNGKVLYSLARSPDGEGGVASFKISDDRSTLSPLNFQPTGDGGAAHLTVDSQGRCLFSAQYSGGSVAVFPLDSQGKILPRSDLVEHEGSGPNANRQKGPHPHWVGLDPANRFLFVPDLGIDRVVIYEVNWQEGRLRRHGAGVCPPGSGPRHMKFHPNGRFAYVLNELGLTVTVFRYDADQGNLMPIQTISTLPESMREVPTTASEIRIHPSGRFVYTANRGHDSITVFQIQQETGELAFVEHEPVRGSWPRNFNIDPSGRWLLAAGRNSNTIAVFRIDQDTGGLVFAGKTVNCPTPICVEFQKR